MDSNLYAVAIGFSAIISVWGGALLLIKPSPKTKAIIIPTIAGICILPITIYLTDDYALLLFTVMVVSLSAISSYILKKTKTEATLKECYRVALCPILLLSLPLCIINMQEMGYLLLLLSPAFMPFLIFPLVLICLVIAVGTLLGYFARQKSSGDEEGSKSTLLLLLNIVIIALLIFVALYC